MDAAGVFYFLLEQQRQSKEATEAAPAIIRYFQHPNYYNILLLTAAVFLPARLF